MYLIALFNRFSNGGKVQSNLETHVISVVYIC
jgi:hypothetical protein